MNEYREPVLLLTTLSGIILLFAEHGQRTHSISAMIISLRANTNKVRNPQSICYSPKSQYRKNNRLIKTRNWNLKIQQIYVSRKVAQWCISFKGHINRPISTMYRSRTRGKKNFFISYFTLVFRSFFLFFSLFISCGLSHIDVTLASFCTSE